VQCLQKTGVKIKSQKIQPLANSEHFSRKKISFYKISTVKKQIFYHSHVAQNTHASSV